MHQISNTSVFVLEDYLGIVEVKASVMIEANYLRKGNNVWYNGRLYTVTQILWNRVELQTMEDGSEKYLECQFSELESVKVTPAILEQLGFEKHERFPHRDVYYLKQYNFIINILRDNCEVSFGLDSTVAIVQKGQLYLHQLQNLFFVLLHRELKSLC